MFERIREFLKEFRVEMRKVSWPSRREVIASTGVVLVVVIIIASYLGLSDLLFSKFLRVLLN